MARFWTFPRGPGKERVALPDTTTDDLVDLWAGTPELRPDSIWERIANDLGEQVAPRWYIPQRLAPMIETQRRVAAAAATLAIMIFASTLVAMSGGATGESGYRTDLSLLAMTTSQALNDGVLSPGELDSLNAIAAELTDYFADPTWLAQLTNTELDQTIGTFAAARAALLETDTLGTPGAEQTLQHLAALSAVAINARVSRGPLETLVVARPLDPQRAVSTEIFAADELPLSIAVGGAGAVQLLGSVAGLELGAVTTPDGWSMRAVQTFGRSVVVHFSTGAERIEVGATLQDDEIVLQVARVVTESSDETALPGPIGAPAFQTFAVRLAGFVVLTLAGDGLRVQNVQSEPGWFESVVSDAGRVEVTFSNSSSRLRFSARLRNGVIHSEVRLLQVAPSTSTQSLETRPAAGPLVDPPAADPPVAPTGDDPPPVNPSGDDPPPVDPPGDDPPPVDPPAADPPPFELPSDDPPPVDPPSDDPPPVDPPSDAPPPVDPPSGAPPPVEPPSDDAPPVDPPVDDPPGGGPSHDAGGDRGNNGNERNNEKRGNSGLDNGNNEPNAVGRSDGSSPPGGSGNTTPPAGGAGESEPKNGSPGKADGGPPEQAPLDHGQGPAAAGVS